MLWMIYQTWQGMSREPFGRRMNAWKWQGAQASFGSLVPSLLERGQQAGTRSLMQPLGGRENPAFGFGP